MFFRGENLRMSSLFSNFAPLFMCMCVQRAYIYTHYNIIDTRKNLIHQKI